MTQITLHPANYVTIRIASAITGLSVDAINGNIDQGRWVEGQEYRIGPDGGRYVRMEGFYKWIERGKNGQKRVRNPIKAAINIDRVHMGRETAQTAVAD